MDDYAGRVLADRYRLPLPPADEYELAQTRAFDTYSGQEVLVRQVPLPEVVEAEVLGADGLPDGFTGRAPLPGARRAGTAARAGGATRTPSDPAVRRAIEAAQAAAQIPDHPRLDQVFDVFAEDGSLWIVSEVVAASPLAALLAEAPLSPYRAAEVAADVLTALRALHAHGWVHRNITTRTVLVCEDGRVLLTGLAAGAAEEALCGYDPTPDPAAAPAPLGDVRTAPHDDADPGTGSGPADSGPGAPPPTAGPGAPRPIGPAGPAGPDTGGRAAPALGPATGTPPQAPGTPPATGAAPGTEAGGAGGGTGPGRYPAVHGADARAARAGAIAAYRAGARAAARSSEEQRAGAPRGLTPARPDGPSQPPGQIADPYGVGPSRLPVPGQDRYGQDGGGRDGHAGDGAEVDRYAGGVHPGDEGAPAPSSGWDQEDGWDAGAGGAPPRGPATPLAAERARQARMAVVGPVTERWAPEQAGPVHENWRLAPPVGPATDLWALGALLFRAVQGHAPYPEDSTPELVEMVCSEPPAFAEDCGPLRPVVESLLRQDPAERPDFEELRGWLRSLIRSAPEPDAGTHVVAAPPPDVERLPIVRRRGELVRRRKGTVATHGRHKRGRQAAPRRLGRTLLAAVLVGLAAAVAYAMLFMPKSGTSGQQVGAGGPGPTPGQTAGAGSGDTTPGQGGAASGGEPDKSPGSDQPQTTQPDLPDGYALQKDTAGFRIAVPDGWHRQPKNAQGQIVYSKGALQLIVVPGRDSSSSAGSDPMAYQREKERELQPYRESSWATSSGMRTTEVGDRVMAEGAFTWQGSGGGETYVRNMALLAGGRYHVVQVKGPETQRDKVDDVYEQASATYQYTG